MKTKLGGGGRSGVLWGAAFVIIFALLTAVAFAGQRVNYGKHVIEGKPTNRHAIEMLLDESLDPAYVAAGKTISTLRGRFKIDKDKPVEDAVIDFIDRHRNAFGLKNPKAELKLLRKDENLILFEQIYNGVPIWGKRLGATVVNGEIVDIGGGNIPTPNIDTTPLITAEEALGIAKADLKIPSDTKLFPPEKELVIYNNVLAYKVVVKRWLYFIDAKKGVVLSKDSLAIPELVSGTGVTFNNYTANI